MNVQCLSVLSKQSKNDVYLLGNTVTGQSDVQHRKWLHCFSGSASNPCSTTPTTVTLTMLSPTTSSALSPVTDRTPGAGKGGIVVLCHGALSNSCGTKTELKGKHPPSVSPQQFLSHSDRRSRHSAGKIWKTNFSTSHHEAQFIYSTFNTRDAFRCRGKRQKLR